MNYCHYKIDRYFLFVLGIGTGLGHITGIVVIGYNFDRRLSLASGVAVSGVGVGMLTLSTMMQFARDYYGDFGFFMFLAGVYFHLVVFGMVCFPSSLELGAQTKRKLESKENSKTNFNISSMVQSYLKVGLNKGCLCLCFAMFTYCFSTCLLYLHLPEYIISKGFQAADGTFLLALSGVTTMIGRFLTGLLQNFKIFTGMFLYIVTMIIVAIAIGVFPFLVHSSIGQIMCIGSVGLFFGSCYVVLTVVTLMFVDISYLAAAIGLQMFFAGIGTLAGTVSAGIYVI